MAKDENNKTPDASAMDEAIKGLLSSNDFRLNLSINTTAANGVETCQFSI